MGLFTKLTSKKAERRGIYVGPSSSLVIPPPNNAIPVNNDTAMRITAFYAGIRLISENVAALPKSIRRYTEKGPVNASYKPAYRLISVRPNDYTNAYDFWNVMTTWLEGWGNAYAIIKRNGQGLPVALHQVHPASVEISVVNGRKWYKVTMLDSNFSWLNNTYSDEDMLHFMLVTLDGIKGVNPVIYNALSLGKGLATEKFGAEYFEKGGNIRAVMEVDGELGDDAYNQFMAHYKASSNNFETPLLEYGIKYKPLSIDPVAAQLVQSETFSLQDVCRILNIPPHMIGELSHATFSNIEHQTIQFVQYTLRPIVKRFEMEMETKLFFSDEEGKYDVKFILDGLLRGDTAARSTYYPHAILDGYMSRNEVRELEGLQHVDGLDEMLYPLNTGIVGKEEETNQDNG
ncbi:MAG: phage portal protein [Bacteroidales bacterium]|nr:phage portal protein [Bacteroidales bacterium]